MSTLPALTPEMRQALDANGGLPVEVTDPLTQKVYLLVEKGKTATPHDEYIQRELEKGLADFEAGRFAPWDIEKTIAKAREAFFSEPQ